MNNLQKIQNLTGSNFRGDRRKDDFYASSPEMAQAILPKLQIPDRELIWEPCAGDGAIAKILVQNGYRVTATDLVSRNYPITLGHYETGPEFDATTFREMRSKYIITNPPFNIADKILKNFMTMDFEVLALFHKSHWLQAGVKRGWIMKEFPPSDIYALGWRVDWTGQGQPTGDGAWFVWNNKKPGSGTQYHLLDKP